ncbi:MAG: IPT/TIG domain-containing protein, partial [Candidatus Nomurabacteria bacterium]|nr:IPT/TIG domain-containing protein [Candidatus Nomurabacteria bacterium]
GGAGASAGYSNAGGGGSGYLFTSTSDKTGYSGNIPNSKYYLSDAATTADVCYGNGIVRITNITNNIVTIDSGGNPANCAITSWSDTKITCVTSPHVVGTFDVTVTNAVGSSPDNGTNDDFTYAYPAQDGAKIQDVTNDTCSTTKTWAYDERDNHTYYIQKIPNSGADGNDKDLCWMLTNLAYIGSEGTVILSDDSITSSYVTTTETGNIPQEYTTPLVHIAPGGISYTAAPTIPSDSGEQYGYLYNWCAAVGAQTSACTDYLTYPSMDATITICPQGWRLPRSMDFQTLNYAVNSGSTASDSGLRSDWLGVYSGYYYYNGLAGQNSTGLYWSSTWYGHYESNANLLRFSSSIAYLVPWGRDVGVAVRCVR